jgi:hypothetical protein
MNTDTANRWDPRPIAASTFLRDLREECLTRSEKRMPKWKFRVAPDFIIQLQPKATYLPSARQIESGVRCQVLRFDGVALTVATGNATKEMFDRKPNSQATPWCRVGFEIYAYDESAWQLKPRSGRWSRSYGEGGSKRLIERVVTTFADGFFSILTPDALLGNHCLICGKGLTDPASMARRVGPECAGTSSLVVPYIIKSRDVCESEQKQLLL